MFNDMIRRCELVEIPIAATAARTLSLFQPSQNLIGRRVRIYAVSAYTATQLAVSPSGRTVIPNADAVNLTVNFIKDSNDIFDNSHPYYELVRANMSGWVTLFQPVEVTLEKCYLQVMAAGTLATTQSALIRINYELL